MVAPISLARGTALCAALLILWGADGRARAEPDAQPVPGNGVYPNGRDCKPKAITFGHYQGGWRKWPGELRPDETFPQSIGAEQLPAPEGVKEIPLPVETLPPEGTEPLPGLPKPDAEMTLPTEDVQGPGDILPPGRKIRIEDRSPFEQPLKSPTPLEPPEGDVMPRLPLEIPPAKTPPRLPLETPPAGTPPRLPLEMPPTKTPPRLPQLDLPPAKTPPRLPLEPVAPRRKELPAEDPRPEPSSAGQSPDRSALPTSLEARVGDGRPVEGRRPKDGRGANPIGGRPPTVQENVPVPAEPWAKPRPWRPEPARQATYQGPIEPRPPSRPWTRPFEPRIERPVQRPVEQPAPQSADRSQQPLGLDGYCAVRLAETEQWVVGDPRWAVSYQGYTYQTSGPDLQRRFLANPSRYAPVVSGQDPVLALDEKCSVPGQTEFCVVYDGRLYMFSSAATLARFHQNPKRYSAFALERAP